MLEKLKKLKKQKPSEEEKRKQTLEAIASLEKSVVQFSKMLNTFEVEKSFIDAGLEKATLQERVLLAIGSGCCKSIIWVSDSVIEYMQADLNSKW